MLDWYERSGRKTVAPPHLANHPQGSVQELGRLNLSESAQAGFWSALSLPPLLLGMLGTMAYVAPLFGPDMLPNILRQLLSTAHSVFSPAW